MDAPLLYLPERRASGRRYVWAAADGGPAARARWPAGRLRSGAAAQVQPVIEAVIGASHSTSTRSRSSFSKARQRAMSAGSSNGPCSRPVSSSITVQVGSETGMPLKCAEP